MYERRKSSSSEFQVKKVRLFLRPLSTTHPQPSTTNIEEDNSNSSKNSDNSIDISGGFDNSSSRSEVGKETGAGGVFDKNPLGVVKIRRKRKKRSTIIANKKPMSSLAATATATSTSTFLTSSTSSPETSSPASQAGERTLGILIGDEEESFTMNPSSATVSHALISVIGRRRSMEDAVTVVPRLVHVSTAADPEVATSFDFFAVYDGHGGYAVAQRCKERLHHLVAAEITADIERSTATRGGEGLDVDWERVMGSAFARMDEEVAAEVGEDTAMKPAMGSTALVVVVGKEEVVVANCGDCRSVLGSGGAALPLSRDHKPERPDEKERVEAAGGNVVNWDCSRVLGVLATSRSIGDHYLKPYVTAEPEVTVHKRSLSDEFLIIASDGLWDVVSNEVAVELVRKCFCGQLRRKVLEKVSGNCAAAAATILAEVALARGSRDNISVIVVELQRPTAASSSASSP